MKRIGAMVLAAVIGLALVSPAVEAQQKPGWPKVVTIGSASVGGTSYIIGGGFTKLISEKVGVTANNESTGGAIHNVQLAQDKAVDFGISTAGAIWEGFNGVEWAKGEKYGDVRVVFPMHTTYFQMYSLRKSGIKSLADLNGKTVGVGPVGGTPATYFPKIFETAGVKPSRVVNASSADLDSQLKDGMLVANGQALGLPWVTITEAETTHEVTVYGVPSDVSDRFIAKFPYFTRGVIPKGTYKSNPAEDIPTISVFNFMIANKAASEEFVYEVVKKTFENLPIIVAAHKAAADFKAENIVHSPIPVHPGAVKYYREKGIAIPDKLIAK
jgi:hypothetical protein